jgi:Protein of unknown function (DUF4013)
MPTTTCPKCGANGRVPDTFIGRRVRCPRCQEPFTVTAAPEPPAKAPAAPAPAGVKPKAPPAAAPPPRATTPRPAPPPPPEDDLYKGAEEADVEVAVVGEDGAAAVSPVTGGGSVQYLRAFQYIFENPKWLTNILLTALCYLIPIVGPLVASGYLYEVVESLATRGERRYPDFDFGRFGKYLMRGLWPFLMTLIIYLPIWMALGVVGIVCGFILPDILLHLYAGVEYILLLFVLPLAMMPLWLRTGLSQSLDLGATFKFAPDFFKRVGKEAVIAQLLLAAAGVVLSMVGMMLCCVGMVVALAVLVLAYANLYAQLYQLYVQRGGQPIPLKQESIEGAGDEPEPAV